MKEPHEMTIDDAYDKEVLTSRRNARIIMNEFVHVFFTSGEMN